MPNLNFGRNCINSLLSELLCNYCVHCKAQHKATANANFILILLTRIQRIKEACLCSLPIAEKWKTCTAPQKSGYFVGCKATQQSLCFSWLPSWSLERMEKLRLAPSNSWIVTKYERGREYKKKDFSSISKIEIPHFLIFFWFWNKSWMRKKLHLN